MCGSKASRCLARHDTTHTTPHTTHHTTPHTNGKKAALSAKKGGSETSVEGVSASKRERDGEPWPGSARPHAEGHTPKTNSEARDSGEDYLMRAARERRSRLRRPLLRKAQHTSGAASGNLLVTCPTPPLPPSPVLFSSSTPCAPPAGKLFSLAILRGPVKRMRRRASAIGGPEASSACNRRSRSVCHDGP